MRQFLAFDFENRIQYDAGTGAVVGTQCGVRIAGDNELATPNRTRSHAQRDRVNVCHQQSPAAPFRSWQFDNEIAHLTATGAILRVGLVVLDERSRDSSRAKTIMDRFRDEALITALSGNRHHLGHQFDGSRLVDFGNGGRLFRGHVGFPWIGP